MIGSIGIDIQGSRAAVCLMEWSGGLVRQGPVGDGRRMLVPVAPTATSWGSPAAEAVLSALPASTRLADSLYAWRQDAWNAEFLAGLQRRLLAFLGQPQLASARSHQVCVCADLVLTGDWATAAGLLDEAGLPGTEPVRPADALLCRWLSERRRSRGRGRWWLSPSGENATMVSTYAVDADPALAVRPAGESRVDAGCGPWVVEFAADALRLCRPGVPARALLSLLDGMDEFAAVLRVAPADMPVEWAGPLSPFMFDPVRASRRELAGRPAVTGFTRPVASAVRAALSGVAGRATVLGGGPGAAWPFVADALDGVGTVWQSGDPMLDLAYGVCWWEPCRLSFPRRRHCPAAPGGPPRRSRSPADPPRPLAPPPRERRRPGRPRPTHPGDRRPCARRRALRR